MWEDTLTYIETAIFFKEGFYFVAILLLIPAQDQALRVLSHQTAVREARPRKAGQRMTIAIA